MELLTVVAVVGLLAAILVPVVGRVRQAQCASNLRQLGLATSIWYQNNLRAKLTPQLTRATSTGTENISWIAALLPYLNTQVGGYDAYGSAPDLTHCPSVRPDVSWQKNSRSLNIFTSDANWKPGMNTERDPARTILAGDVVGTTLNRARPTPTRF